MPRLAPHCLLDIGPFLLCQIARLAARVARNDSPVSHTHADSTEGSRQHITSIHAVSLLVASASACLSRQAGRFDVASAFYQREIENNCACVAFGVRCVACAC